MSACANEEIMDEVKIRSETPLAMHRFQELIKVIL